MTPIQANVCVFAPTLYLTVTVEALSGDDGADDLHFHPGGQGFWIARMLRGLGERPVVVAPVGGESGLVLRGLLPAWKVEMSLVDMGADSPAYLHDRRSGERHEIARTRLPTLNRHESDDLYGRVLALAATAGTCVVTGRTEAKFPSLDFYRRLGADLASMRVRTVGDLHADELRSFLEGGPLHTLKVSDADLAQDGVMAEDAGLDERAKAAAALEARGARRVVISSAKGPTLARFEGVTMIAEPPSISAADHRGSGDAMTAGLTMAALRGFDAAAALRVGCASGAANVTRRGLGSADAGLVESLAEKVVVREVKGQ